MTPAEVDALLQQAAGRVAAEWVDSPRLTGFGNSVARLRAVEEAQVAALESEGVTEQDMQAWARSKNQPAQAPRSTLTVEKVTAWHEKAVEKAERAEAKADRLQAALDARDAQRGPFDHGMLQLPLKTRQRGLAGQMREFRELQEARERAEHYRHVASKWQRWLEKNEDET